MTTDLGFEFDVLEDTMKSGSGVFLIRGPKEYKNSSYSHGVFITYYNEKQISVTSHSYLNSYGQPEFYAEVEASKEIKFEITFNYGPPHCSNHVFYFEIIGNNGT